MITRIFRNATQVATGSTPAEAHGNLLDRREELNLKISTCATVYDMLEFRKDRYVDLNGNTWTIEYEADHVLTGEIARERCDDGTLFRNVV